MSVIDDVYRIIKKISFGNTSKELASELIDSMGGGGGGIGGSIADQQIPFGTGADTVAGSENFKWNNTDAALSLGVEGLPVSTTGNFKLTNQFELKAQNANNDTDIPLFTWNGQTLKMGDQDVFGPEFILDSRFGGSGELDGGGYARVRSIGDVDIQADSGDIGLAASGVVNIQDVLSLTLRDDPPGSPVEGMIYADTDHHLYYYNGTAWKQLDN